MNMLCVIYYAVFQLAETHNYKILIYYQEDQLKHLTPLFSRLTQDSPIPITVFVIRFGTSKCP